MYVLPDLPYSQSALEPVISAATMRLHHGKHHATYVEKANALAKEAGLAGLPLEELIVEATKRDEQKLFNNAAQAWNHAFFWESMTPEQTAPGGELAKAIAAVGGLAELKAKFVDEGVNHFASGWVWLTACEGKLEVISTHDADDTFTHRCAAPLLICDLWEHAYYLDHKNDRKAFLTQWFDRLANWDFAAAQWDAAQGEGEGYRFPQAAEATA